MYNPEALYYSENDFSIASSEDLDEIFDEQFLEAGEEEGIFSEEDFDDEEFSEDETIFESDTSDLPDLDDDTSLTRLSNEINEDVSGMNEGQAQDYMESRMAEFFPALASVLPTIVQLAPKAISAISSVLNSIKGGSSQQPPASVVPTPGPSAVTPAAPITATSAVPVSTIASVLPVIPASGTSPQSLPVNGRTGAGIDPSLIELLRAFMELIQSPKILELLSGMQSGKPQSVTANNGQQINSSNVLGVISSAAGTLAGNTNKQSTESFFPEYVMNHEGNFLIDPHNVLQEAELILDLLN